MKKRRLLTFALLLLLAPLPLLAEEEDVQDDLGTSAGRAPTLQEQLMDYRDSVACVFNQTNYLKSVIVVIRPLLAEAELAEFLFKEQPANDKRFEFMKKWQGEYRKFMNNGYGFRLTFQLRNNFIDQHEAVNIPRNIADHFTLLSSSGVKTKPCKCVSDLKLPRDISFDCPELNVDIYFNTRDESGKPLINKRTKAIRLQSSAVNAKFGSYNFSWWLPFKNTVKRPVAVQRILGSKTFDTFIAAHPEVYSEKIAYEDAQGRSIPAKQNVAAKKSDPVKKPANADRKVLTDQEKSELSRKALGAFLFFGLLAP